MRYGVHLGTIRFQGEAFEAVYPWQDPRCCPPDVSNVPTLGNGKSRVVTEPLDLVSDGQLLWHLNWVDEARIEASMTIVKKKEGTSSSVPTKPLPGFGSPSRHENLSLMSPRSLSTTV